MGSNHDVKLGDFGLAKYVQSLLLFSDCSLNTWFTDACYLYRELDSESKFAQTHVGTPYYMSPVSAAHKMFFECFPQKLL